MAQEAWIKRFLPRGLYGRAALILVLPVISVTLVVTVTFIQRHFDRVTRQMTTAVVDELTLIGTHVDAASDIDAARRVAQDLGNPLRLVVTLPGQVDPAGRLAFYDLSGRAVVDELTRLLPKAHAVDLSVRNRVMVALDSKFGPMLIGFDRSRVTASNPHQLLVLMLFTSLLTSGIAFIFLRNQLRPIRRLADAADQFGRGRHLHFRPAGAIEVRAAGAAFLAMRTRIDRQIEQRTLMLSGVSHDLRTPLTRLRLGLSMLSPDTPPDPDEIADLVRDVDDMASLVDAFLDFARGSTESGASEAVTVVPFLRMIVENCQRLGQDVTLGALRDGDAPMSDEQQIPMREILLRRAITNLINNAVRYGSQARLGADLGPRNLLIWVEDDGPGIPKHRQAEALRPFLRLDPARNQDLGQGVGLGLSIATDAARMHGGQLRFAIPQDLDGLRVEILLPR